MSAKKTPTSRKKPAARSKSGAASKKSRQSAKQRAARSTVLDCPTEGCSKTYKTESGLTKHVADKHPPADHVAPVEESTVEAVKRALTTVSDAPKRAVLVATVRRLAEALDDAEPTDRPKISKELAARMAELMADARPDGTDPDWTEQ